ncbi:MAG: ABC transporter ATP-binding protein [Planctomycetes bacterium]|nr:ABC transporter ATP-binding protein [Planctomycetota bacterium]
MTDRPAPPIIELQEVWKSFGPLDVLRGVDLAIRPGATTVIIGPSGCGKSVLLKHMVGLLHPDRGRVRFDGRDIAGLGETALRPVRRRIGFVFQSGGLFDSMTVQENVCFPLAEHRHGSSDEWADRCREALRVVGLDGLQTTMPGQLSGGQRKRVALARAIVTDPDVILYDEPTTGLDPIRADLINELIVRLKTRARSTAVVVTHDMTSARKVADRIVMLYEGRFIADTTPDALDGIDDDQVRRFVQGQAAPEQLRDLQVVTRLTQGQSRTPTP